MEFELTNKQRKYLGLEIVPFGWEKIKITNDAYIYFEENIIRKKINVTESSYIEIELNEETFDRKILLPKTIKGKQKKLTPSVLESITGAGMNFIFTNGEIRISNFKTQKNYYSTTFENYKIDTTEQLNLWLDKFITETTKSELIEIEKFANEKRKKINLLEGDFFVFKVDRISFGFGRLISDIRKIRNNPNFKTKKNYGLAQLMTQPLVIKIYHFIDIYKNQDLNFLKSLPSLPSQYIMDNPLYYGEFEVIGNLPLEDTEIDFPISYAKSITYGDTDTVYLQYGEIYLETSKDIFSKHIKIPNPNSKYDWDKCLKFNPFRNETMWNNLKLDKFTLKQIILEKSNKSYWENKNFELEDDLRNPLNFDIKSEIFDFFGLDVKKSYSENLKKTTANSGLAQLGF